MLVGILEIGKLRAIHIEETGQYKYKLGTGNCSIRPQLEPALVPVPVLELALVPELGLMSVLACSR